MEAVVDWIKSIAYYVIAVSVFHGILPDNRYKKYVQLFTGLILVLLILSPILQLADEEDNMASFFMEHAEEVLQGEFAGEEENSQTMLFIETEIRQMMGTWGYEVRQCRMSLDTQGQVCKINLTLGAQRDGSIQAVAPVIQPEISLENTINSAASGEDAHVIEVLTKLLAEQYGLEAEQIRMKIQ